MKNKIRQIRERKGMTQSELARKLGYSRSYMNKVENGHTSINVKLALRICKHLDCTLNDIFLP